MGCKIKGELLWQVYQIVNTALRDTHQDLDGFCRTRDVEKDEIISKLKTINYEYNVELNKFV